MPVLRALPLDASSFWDRGDNAVQPACHPWMTSNTLMSAGKASGASSVWAKPSFARAKPSFARAQLV